MKEPIRAHISGTPCTVDTRACSTRTDRPPESTVGFGLHFLARGVNGIHSTAEKGRRTRTPRTNRVEGRAAGLGVDRVSAESQRGM